MREETREEWLRPRLETLNRRHRVVPEQARAIDLVPRAYQASELDSPEQWEVAAAAARVAVAREIENRWPGNPYVIRQGRGGEYPGLDLDVATDAMVVLGVVYHLPR